MIDNNQLITDISQKVIIVNNDGKVLAVCDKDGDAWELPGGRLHENESPEDG